MPAGRCSTQTGVGTFECGGVAFVQGQAVVIVEFFAARDIAQGIDEHAAVFLAGFAVWLAGMVDPAGIVAVAAAVDDLAVFQAEKERMEVVGRLGVFALYGFFPGDVLAFIFDDAGAFGDLTGGEDASAVDTGVFDHPGRAVGGVRVAITIHLIVNCRKNGGCAVRHIIATLLFQRFTAAQTIVSQMASLRGHAEISCTILLAAAGALLRCAPLAVLALRRIARLASHPATTAKLHSLFLREPLAPLQCAIACASEFFIDV